MTSDADLERIAGWIAFCSMPGEDNPTLQAIARQFPRMLAALRFVEEHRGPIRQGLVELWAQAELGNSDFTETQASTALDAYVKLALLLQRTPST